jgi:hypothetical protein
MIRFYHARSRGRFSCTRWTNNVRTMPPTSVMIGVTASHDMTTAQLVASFGRLRINAGVRIC